MLIPSSCTYSHHYYCVESKKIVGPECDRPCDIWQFHRFESGNEFVPYHSTHSSLRSN